MMQRVGVREGYDLWAPTYAHDGNPLIAVEAASRATDMARLGVRGLRVADLGCGTGRHTVAALSAGAAHVHGVDGSDGMLARAKSAVGAMADEARRRCTLSAIDLLSPSWSSVLGDAAFDLVLCSLVLEHFAPQQLPRFFVEAARVCRPGGRVVVTVQHPSLNARRTTARFTGDDGATTVVVGDEPTNRTADYVSAALGTGLRIEELGEHGPSDFPSLVERVPRAAKYAGEVTLLTLVLRRPAARL